MKRLIHQDFEIDLSRLKITDTQENSCFADSFFSRISFPFEIDLTKDFDIAFGFISSYNTKPETFYELKYVEDDTIYDAELEITEINGLKLQCTFEYGLEEFAVWSKKLSELPLHKFDLPSDTTIYQHAGAIVDMGYPETDYCFPAIHTDKYDTTEAPWTDFGKMYNRLLSGVFPENTVDGANVSHIRNIMQAAVYKLYILKCGFESAGFTLAGDILTDPDIVNAFIFSPKEIFRRSDQVSYDYFVNSEDAHDFYADDWDGHVMSEWVKTVNIPEYGEFHLSGYVVLYSGLLNTESVEIRLNGGLLYTGGSGSGDLSESFGIDFATNNTGTNTLEVRLRSLPDPSGPWMLISYGLIRTDEYDSAGVSIPAIQNFDTVDLTAVVPDVTFGDYVKCIKNWHNYDMVQDGTTIFMNKIQNYLEVTDPKDISHYEVRQAPRKFQRGLSFLLKFADVESKVYTFDKVFHSAAGYSITPAVDKKTQTIEINALPLPMLDRNGIKTAHAFEESDSKMYVGLYTGLHDGNNSTDNPGTINLPSVHERKWKDWFTFRINAQSFKIVFKEWAVRLSDLKLKRSLWAYNQNHLIKTLIRTEIKPDLYEVELDTEAIR